MAPRRYLRCLGQPALFAATGELIRFRTKKHLALLVYLAIEADQSHRRDRLAELLWPRVSLAEARHSLATALSTLRPRVGADGLRATVKTLPSRAATSPSTSSASPRETSRAPIRPLRSRSPRSSRASTFRTRASSGSGRTGSRRAGCRGHARVRPGAGALPPGR